MWFRCARFNRCEFVGKIPNSMNTFPNERNLNAFIPTLQDLETTINQLLY